MNDLSSDQQTGGSSRIESVDRAALALSAGAGGGAQLGFAGRDKGGFVLSGDSASVALCVADAAAVFALGLATHAAAMRHDYDLSVYPVLLAGLAGVLTACGMIERRGYSPGALLAARPALKDLALALLQAFGAVFLVRTVVLVWYDAVGRPVSAALTLLEGVWLVAFALASFVAMVGLRLAWRRIAPSMVLPLRVLIVGSGEVYNEVLHRARNAVALEVTGVLCDRADGADAAGLAASVLRMIRQDRVDAVVIALPWVDGTRIHTLAAEVAAAPVDIYIAPDLPTGDFVAQSVSMLAGLPVVKLSGRPLSAGRAALKRAEDLALATVLLVLAAPAMLIIAALIKLTSRGPVFFRQRRLGYNHEIIEILKFRTMYADATDRDARRQTSRGDPRVTPLGLFLRRSSLDELPQLLNVLAGDMSMVGPRPHALQTTVHGLPLEQAVSDYMARHRVKPGITGWAQVNGYRGELDSVEKLAGRVDCDLDYIRNWSLALDLKIIWRTTRLVLSDPHAY